MSKEAANRIHQAHKQGMLELFGPDVIKGEMNVMSGEPHISACAGGIDALLRLIVSTTRAVETETSL